MGRTIARVVVAWLLFALAAPLTVAGFQVQPDKENVVAGRLEGEWRLDVPMTTRLFNGQRASRYKEVIVRSDASVAEKVPAKYDEFLGKKRIYLAGHITLRGKEHPFILIEHSGNPYIVYFRERDGDPMGDGESFNVMLAPGKDKDADLLFIGGDFNNQPFTAYTRAVPGADAGLSPEQVMARWVKAVLDGDLEAFLAVHSQHVKARFDRKAWEKHFAEHHKGFKEAFGAANLGDFQYQFNARGKGGAIRLIYKGKPLADLDMVKEAGAWKINER